MTSQKTSSLYDQKQSLEFYEDRYDEGYMEEWPAEYKGRLLDIIRELELPATGAALDFGCGNGVLTDVLRQALPSWNIYGTDLSRKAIANARKRYPQCTFLEADDPFWAQNRFDFIFTNHVFEHVFELEQVFRQAVAHLRPESSMLHVLPCGNEGSYERGVCRLRKDGIDPALGGRFFFEDAGHVRRLTSEQMQQLCEAEGFLMEKAFYANHYYGAVNWITRLGVRFVDTFTETSQALDRGAKKKLFSERRFLRTIALLRYPSHKTALLLQKKNKGVKHYIGLILGLPLAIFSRPVDRYWTARAVEEWNARKFDPCGSEMYLYFKRRQPR